MSMTDSSLTDFAYSFSNLVDLMMTLRTSLADTCHLRLKEVHFEVINSPPNDNKQASMQKASKAASDQ